MAMRHSRLLIFAGGFLALAVMSVLSAVLGHILPTLLPRRYTTIAAAILFFVFGGMMLREGLEMEGGNAKIQEELREVQKEVEEVEEKNGPVLPMTTRDEDNGKRLLTRPSASSNRNPPSSPSLNGGAPRSSLATAKEGIVNLFNAMVHPVLLQTFIMTFLAEWGDRSQISTIALAAAHVSGSKWAWSPFQYARYIHN